MKYLWGVCALLTSSVALAGAGDVSYEQYDFPIVKERAKPLLILVPGGETFQVVRAQNDTCGNYMFAKLIVPPGQGPAPHVHHWTDEWFYAPEGGIQMIHGKKPYASVTDIPGENAPKSDVHLFEMRKKELYFAPRDYVHGFMNSSGRTRELYLVWTPDKPGISILNYFLRSGKVLSQIDENEKPSYLSKIRGVTLAPEYGFNQSSYFWQFLNVNGVDESMPSGHMNNQKERLEKLMKESEHCFQ